MVGAPFTIYIAFSIGRILVANQTLAPFKPYLEEYTYLPGKNAGRPGLQISMAQPSSVTPYLEGKAIAVQVRGVGAGSESELDNFYFWLPKELRATSPDEVESIIWLDCSGHRETFSVTAGDVITVYTYRNAGTIWSCEVAVIDKSSQTIVAQKSFIAEPSSDSYEDALYKEIVKYIEGLTRK
jgi:hypothetical protein